MERGLTAAAVGVLTLAVVIAVPVLAEDTAAQKTDQKADSKDAPTEIAELVTVTPGKPLTSAQAARISAAAGKVMRHIVQARAYIAKKDSERAKTELEDARKRIDKIRRQLPTTKVQDTIWIAKKHLAYEATADVIPDLIPIYASLTEIADLLPVEAARAHVDNAKNHLENDNKTAAEHELTEAGDALVYIEIDLPLSSTESHVVAAQRALDNKDLGAADKALSAAEDGVQLIAIGVYTLFAEAKHHLRQAQHAYAAGNSDAAKTHLDQAKAALARAAKSGDEKTKSAVKALSQEIGGLQAKLGAGVNEQHVSSLKSYWRRAKALSERAVTNFLAHWQEFQATSTAERELVDARMHVSYAETYQTDTGDSEQALAELAKAEMYVKKAAPGVKSGGNAKIEAIEQNLAAAKSEVEKSGPDVETRYAAIIGDLTWLIQRVFLTADRPV